MKVWESLALYFSGPISSVVCRLSLFVEVDECSWPMESVLGPLYSLIPCSRLPSASFLKIFKSSLYWLALWSWLPRPGLIPSIKSCRGIMPSRARSICNDTRRMIPQWGNIRHEEVEKMVKTCKKKVTATQAIIIKIKTLMEGMYILLDSSVDEVGLNDAHKQQHRQSFESLHCGCSHSPAWDQQDHWNCPRPMLAWAKVSPEFNSSSHVISMLFKLCNQASSGERRNEKLILH